MLEFEVLGPLTVRVAGAEASLGSGRQRLLLALLLVDAGRPTPVPRLIEQIWGDDPPATATAALQVHVSALRKVLGDRLRWTPGGYLLDVPDEAVDARRFEALLAPLGGRGAAGAGGVARLRDAEALWRGEPYGGMGESPALAAERHRLEELRLGAVETRAEIELALGRHEALVPELTPLVRASPGRERLVANLLLALYRSGRPADAQVTYRMVTETLRDQVGVPPSPELAALAEAIGRQDPTLDLPPRSLPLPATRFVGRRAELDQLAAALGTARILTLTGPGGVGKTRLAIQICRETAAGYPDGIRWLDLAGLTDPDGVLPRLADALGVREHPGTTLRESVTARLRTGRHLVVLDNCEHLRPASSDLAGTLLATCPGVRVLATSREPLRVPGEVLWPVAGLSLAGPGGVDATSDAVRLLTVRAREVRRDFRLTDRDTEVAVALCARLDGLPLAIEMAAAQLRTMSINELAPRLARQLDLTAARPTPPRHRTLRAAIDWGYGLLTEPERAAFRRLAVFADGGPLDAAEQVAADPAGDPPHTAAEVASTLFELIERSFVTPSFGIDDAPTRYTMSQGLHDYAVERLAESPDGTAARRRHAQWCRDLAVRSAEFGGDLHGEHLRALRAEQDNLRAALRWCLGPTGDHELALEIAASLWWFWWLTGMISEGRQWLEQAVAATTDRPRAQRAGALRAAAALARSAHDLDAARRWGEEALGAAQDLGETAGVARALNGLCMTANAQRDLTASLRFGRESRRSAEQAGDPRGIAAAANNVGVTLRCLDRLDEAAAEFAEALDRFEAVRDRRGEAAALYNLAVVARRRGQLDASHELCLRSLERYHDLELPEGEADVAEAIACLEVARSRPEAALRLLAAADRSRRELGSAVFTPDEIADRDAALATARSMLGGIHTVPEVTLADLVADLLAAPRPATSTPLTA